MENAEPGKCTLIVSREKLGDLRDLISDASSTPGEDEFSMAIVTMAGTISITKSNGDGDIYWLTVEAD